MIKRLAFIAAMLLIPALAKSDTVWTYTGNIMHGVTQNATNAPGGCGCALDGTFTLSTDILSSQTQIREWGSPVAWNFTDGTHTLTNANSTAAIELTQQAGGPLLWNINIANSSWDFASDFLGSAFEATDSSGVTHWGDPGCCFGFLESNRGTLTESVSLGDGDHDGDDPVSAPEPGSLILLGAGITALAMTIALQKFWA
jgi:hypothetical protein